MIFDYMYIIINGTVINSDKSPFRLKTEILKTVTMTNNMVITMYIFPRLIYRQSLYSQVLEQILFLACNNFFQSTLME